MSEQQEPSVVKLKDGCAEAWAEADQYYSQLLFRYFLKRGLGEQSAAELVTDTLGQAFMRHATLNTEYQSALPWLLAIARNEHRKLLRADKRQARVTELPQHLVSDQEHAAADSEDELEVILHEAISSLSTECQQYFRLLFDDSLNEEQIADQSSVSLSTLRRRHSRCRERLKVKMSYLLRRSP